MAVISKSKIAIVTGGSRGLGKDMALSLARHGIDVILTYHTQKQEADKVADTIRGLGLKASALPFDVSRVSTFDAFLGQVKTVLRETWNTEKVDCEPGKPGRENRLGGAGHLEHIGCPTPAWRTGYYLLPSRPRHPGNGAHLRGRLVYLQSTGQPPN